MKYKKQKYTSKDDALLKLEHYCAYQDRCHKEVREKLLSLGIYGEDLDDIMVSLINNNFLNEERFARSFARGKFRMKKWGKSKIIYALRGKGISDYCLKKAMEEIELEDYNTALISLINKKWKTVKEKNLFLKKGKVAKFIIQKGYEPALVWEQIKLFQPDY